jgi:hypothetical protein
MKRRSFLWASASTKLKDEWKLNGIALGDTTAEDVKAFDVTEPGK